MTKNSRPELLFLSHRIPFPPDKGDKIRSYRWLVALAEHFRVHLGTFVDDPADWKHVALLDAVCASTFFLHLAPKRATLRSAGGLLSNRALSLPYYADRRMRRWVTGRLAQGAVRQALVYSSPMAQYVSGKDWLRVRRVVDFVDVDSDKWLQYAERKRWPMSWVFSREARLLAREEVRIASCVDLSLFVSEEEEALFRTRYPDAGERISSLANGVDCKFFQPDPELPSPYPRCADPVVFTGAMDYWANADAVGWFSTEIWPMVKSAWPAAILAIVGARPSSRICSLARSDILVTGRVPDIRPYLQHARCAVAPMRVARGVQNKILEAMAMAKPVVTTAKGLEGIHAKNLRAIMVADSPRDFAASVVAALDGRMGGFGGEAREFVLTQYDWSRSSERLVGIVSDCLDASGSGTWSSGRD